MIAEMSWPRRPIWRVAALCKSPTPAARTIMKLYSENSSPFSAPGRIAIYAKGLTIEIEPPPGGLLSAKFHAINSLGTIPCLILEDGSPLPESAANIWRINFLSRPCGPLDRRPKPGCVCCNASVNFRS
jgi:hypothetical protein